MFACLLACDALSLAVSGLIAIMFKLVPSGHLASWHSYLRLAPLLPVFLLVYSGIGLYSGTQAAPGRSAASSRGRSGRAAATSWSSAAAAQVICPEVAI